MDSIVSKFYQENLETKSSAQRNYQFNSQDYLIYEVIRTSEGVALFLEDHLARMRGALSVLTLEKRFHESEVHSCLELLMDTNRNQTGNIKLLCKPFKKQLFYAAYYIPHVYPTDIMYRRGVKLVTYEIERPDPKIKQVLVSERIQSALESSRIRESAYEILLIDQSGCITEGSKSNIFFIRDGRMYSPPENKILSGITRKHILQIAGKNNIDVNFHEILLSGINQYDSAFICGTSPKIMPVKRINRCNFKVRNPITDLLLKEYNSEIQQYIDTRIRD